MDSDIGIKLEMWCGKCNRVLYQDHKIVSDIAISKPIFVDCFRIFISERIVIDQCTACKHVKPCGIVMRNISQLGQKLVLRILVENITLPKILKFIFMNESKQLEESTFTLTALKNNLQEESLLQSETLTCAFDQYNAHRGQLAVYHNYSNGSNDLNAVIIKLYTNQHFMTLEDKIESIKQFLKPCLHLSTESPKVDVVLFKELVWTTGIDCLLDPKGWVNGNFLDIISLLLQDLNDRCMAASIENCEGFSYPYKFYSSYHVADLAGKIHQGILYRVVNAEKKFSYYKKLYIPTHVNQCHFVLFEVIVETHEIFVYDSLFDKGDEYWNGTKQLNDIKEWLKLSHRDNSLQFTVKDKSAYIPRQTNSTDCGVFVAQLMCCLGCDIPLKDLFSIYSEQSMKDLRLHYYRAIERGYLLLKPYILVFESDQLKDSVDNAAPAPEPVKPEATTSVAKKAKVKHTPSEVIDLTETD